jgi:hypothetical protein
MPGRDRFVQSDDESSEDFGEVLRERIGDLGRGPQSLLEAAAWAAEFANGRHHGGPERYSPLLSRLTRFMKSLLSRGASEPRRTEENE